MYLYTILNFHLLHRYEISFLIFREDRMRIYKKRQIPCSIVVLEKLIGSQLVKKFPIFHEIRRFLTAVTRAFHLPPLWSTPIHSVLLHPTSETPILILSSYLYLYLASGLFPSGFPIKILYAQLLSPHVLHAPLGSFYLIWFGKEYRS
jgi:hypothetical protein